MPVNSPPSTEQPTSAIDGLEKLGYRVLHALGSGSGGNVYKALQPNTGQAVAVKLLHLDDTEGDVRARRLERFRREIAICSRLYHPDIVRLLSSGDLDDGRQFAVFEYIPGTTLAELLRELGALPVKRARDLMAQLLPPLAYAHSNAIAHRDLKPSNIMVTSDGVRDRVKILDFGISVATRREPGDWSRLTLSNEWVGTPAYAAPEQLRGEAVHEKADLYAWGLMMLECLTGTPVVRGASLVELIESQLRSTPHELPLLLRRHRLGALLARVIDKDARRRLNDANLLLSMLERIAVSDLEDTRGYLREAPRSEAPELARASDTFADEPGTDGRERRSVIIVCTRTFWSPNEHGSGPPSDEPLLESGGHAVRPAAVDEHLDGLDAQLDAIDAQLMELTRQFGATHTQSFGDYTLCYFGLSPGRDRESRLAVRFALELANRLDKGGSANGAGRWHVQIGIHAGRVGVDRHSAPLGGASARLAIRLATLGEHAATGSRVLVSGAFRRLAAGYAVVEPLPQLPPLSLPLSAEERIVFVLVGESEFAGSRPEGSVFVGRVEEIERLEARWRQTREERAGSALLITGEPGIGKSRLVNELLRRHAARGDGAIEVRCLPEWEHSHMRPLSTWLSRELAGEHAPRELLGERLERAVGELGLNPALAVPVLATWLSIPLPPGRAPLAWSPQKQRQLLYQSLADLLIGYAERGAALWFEDVHWADASTLECIEVLLARARNRAVFVLLTARPGARLPGAGVLEEIALAGLSPDAVRELIRSLHGSEAPSAWLVDHIVAHGEGIPLYVEELATALPDRAGDATTASGVGTQPPEPVPVGLRELLSLRLRDLGSARRTAQLAAALGRDFAFSELALLGEIDEFELLGDIEQLISAALVVKRMSLDQASYRFRHALIRDSVYDSMSESLRRHTHERIARGIERHLPEVAAAQPDVLAYHFERAHDAERALAYWQRSALASRQASAHEQALAQLERAAHLLSGLPRSAERDRREAELWLARGTTLVGKRGYTDPGVRESFEAVTRLVPASGQTLDTAFLALWGRWYLHNTQAHLSQAWVLANELRELAANAGRPALVSSSWQAICLTSFCTGRFDEAVGASRACEASYDFDRDRQLATQRGDDPLLACLSFEALAELLRGRHEQAVARVQQGLALADRLGFASMRCAINAQAAWMYLVYGSSGARRPDLTRAREHAAFTQRLAAELGFPFWLALAELVDAAAAIVLREPEGLSRLTRVAGAWRAAGAALGRCWHLAFTGQGLRDAGSHEASAVALRESIEFCASTGSRFFEAEAQRQLAELWLAPDNPQRDPAAAADCLGRAREAARRSGANWWSLAVAVSAYRMDPDAAGARQELADVLARFPPAAHEPPLVAEARELSAGIPENQPR